MMDNDLPTECCAKCRFYSCRNDHQSWCKRFPRSIFLIGDLGRKGYDDPANADNWHFPQMHRDDWCGEFEAVPPAAATAPPQQPEPVKYATLASIPFHLRARKALQQLVPAKTGVPWEDCTIDMLSLFSHNDLRAFKGCGYTTIEEIEDQCLSHGVFLRGESAVPLHEKMPLRDLCERGKLPFRDEWLVKFIGRPELIDSCSMNDLLSLSRECFAPKGSHRDWFAIEFDEWRAKWSSYYRRFAMSPEQH